MDGVSLEVLYPIEAPVAGETDANDVSVVIRVRYGAFEALLTGDAPASVERIIARDLTEGVEVLKVAHHGSDTSTDSLLLARARPEAALISVGRGNRYGHPAAAVVSRLERAGVDLYRTDRQGTLRLRARRDGRFTVETEARTRR